MVPFPLAAGPSTAITGPFSLPFLNPISSAKARCFDRGICRWQGAPPKPAQDDELAADDLAIDEDEEVSADEEVDLETGDEDLGVGTAGEDDES